MRFCLLPPPLVVFPHSDPLALRVGRLWYGPKRQVQGDPVTLEKSSPNQTTWAGVLPRLHHPFPYLLQHHFPCGQGNCEPSYPPDPGKMARAHHQHSAKGSQAGVGWRVFTRGQGKIPCSTRLQTTVTRSIANRLR